MAEDLFRQRYGPMVGLATLLSGSRVVAEEVVMDAFERLIPRIEDLDEPVGYLRTAVVNGVRAHHRRKVVAERFRPSQVDGASSPVELDEFWDRLRGLRDGERSCLVLRYYEDLSLSEIADVLGMPLGTVKSHMHRGIAALRDMLGEVAQ